MTVEEIASSIVKSEKMVAKVKMLELEVEVEDFDELQVTTEYLDLIEYPYDVKIVKKEVMDNAYL